MKSVFWRSKQGDRSADRRYAKQMAALLEAVLESPGATDPSVRHAIYRGDVPSEPDAVGKTALYRPRSPSCIGWASAYTASMSSRP